MPFGSGRGGGGLGYQARIAYLAYMVRRQDKERNNTNYAKKDSNTNKLGLSSIFIWMTKYMNGAPMCPCIQIGIFYDIESSYAEEKR